MYGIVNKRGERLYQYGPFTYYEEAAKCLTNAKEAYPDAGLKIVPID